MTISVTIKHDGPPEHLISIYKVYHDSEDKEFVAELNEGEIVTTTVWGETRILVEENQI